MDESEAGRVLASTMFTKYYDSQGLEVSAHAPGIHFWVQTEADCDLVHDTFFGAYLWSVICPLRVPTGRISAKREFREWEPAQHFIRQLLAAARAKRA